MQQAFPFQQLDQRLAHELAKRKNQQVAKSKAVGKILEESEEIKQLKERIKESYVNKERAA